MTTTNIKEASVFSNREDALAAALAFNEVHGKVPNRKHAYLDTNDSGHLVVRVAECGIKRLPIGWIC